MTTSASLRFKKSLPALAGVYAIIHLDSGKLYIGSAISLVRRHGEHQRILRRNDHENDHLQKAWNKHGADAFEFVALLVCAPLDLLYYEQRALNYYKNTIGWRRMYNSNPTAGSRLGSRMSAKARALLLQRLKGNQYTKGRRLSAEHREKLRISTTRRNLGRKLTQETKAKIGNANRGRVPSTETRAKLSAAGKGRKLSPEHIARLAASPRFRGGHHTEESKRRISESLKNRVFSDEHRAKISAGVRAWREEQRQERLQG